MAGEPGVFMGCGVSPSVAGAAVSVGVGEGLRLSPKKKKAPTATKMIRSKPPPINNRIGSRKLRPFSFSGRATTVGVAATGGLAGLRCEIVFGADVINVGSTTAAFGVCSSNVAGTGRASLPGTCSKTTVILSRPPARFALSINSEVAAGKFWK